jgi:hypothetical protein
VFDLLYPNRAVAAVVGLIKLKAAVGSTGDKAAALFVSCVLVSRLLGASSVCCSEVHSIH